MARQGRQMVPLWSATALCVSLLLCLASPRVSAQITDPEDPNAPTTPNAPTSTAAAPSFNPSALPTAPCSDDSVTFELITGYVYSAPADMLDSQPGTLMLTDCIQTCRQNASCQAINYETGLCVLFSSNADAYPGNTLIHLPMKAK